MTDCELLQIDKKAMTLALQYLVARNIRYEEDLVDQLFNSSEKGLARILLLRARDCNPQDQSGDARRDDRHNPVAGQLFHESVQKIRLR
jgi:hypothetical protein